MQLIQHFVLLATVAITSVLGNSVDTVVKDYRGKHIMDPKGKYVYEWAVDWKQKMIFFNLTVQTTGWVGFGFSKDGLMSDADMVIAGVTPNGKYYVTDFYSDCKRNLKPDKKQDWNVLYATEVGGTTYLQLSRLIDTCDPDDYPITDDLVYEIWAYGYLDSYDYHYENRGEHLNYLLDPLAHASLLASRSPTWIASRSIAIPAKQTTYWCSIHKAPPGITQKQHFIQFQAFFGSHVAVDHTHHMVLYRCLAPPGQTTQAIFEPLVNFPGEECYFIENRQIPIQYCRTIVYFWSLGGKPFVLPDDVGLALGVGEYFLLETHYNNQGKHPQIVFEVGVQGIYTDKLRRHDGGAFLAAYDLTGLFVIPPAQDGFEVYGHCGSDCTSDMFPKSGTDVFAVHLHSHSSARRMKLRHFRKGQEKPWIMKDDNYNFKFQQIRHLHYNRKLLQGDHLTLSCIYDFSNDTTLAGFSAHDKMCVAAIYIVNPIPYYICVSQVAEDKILKVMGIKDITWKAEEQELYVTNPAIYSGLKLRDVSSYKVSWDYNRRERIQAVTIGSTQTLQCPVTTPTTEAATQDATKLTVDYQNVQTPFSRVRYCSSY